MVGPTPIQSLRSVERIDATRSTAAVCRFFFDTTLRERRAMSPAVIPVTKDLVMKLRPRVEELPDRGCFLCKWIIEDADKGNLKQRGEFDVLAEVWHLHLEGIAWFKVACSQCGLQMDAHLRFEVRDLSACTDCAAILAVTEEVEKAQREVSHARDRSNRFDSRRGAQRRARKREEDAEERLNYAQILRGLGYPRPTR